VVRSKLYKVCWTLSPYCEKEFGLKTGWTTSTVRRDEGGEEGGEERKRRRRRRRRKREIEGQGRREDEAEAKTKDKEEKRKRRGRSLRREYKLGGIQTFISTLLSILRR